MATIPVQGAGTVPVSNDLMLYTSSAMTGHARVQPGDDAEVLDTSEIVPGVTLPHGMDDMWQPASAAAELHVTVRPPEPEVLGEAAPPADAMLRYTPPDPDAAYVAVQQIHTADGLVFYDFDPTVTFPIRALPPVAPDDEPVALGIGDVLTGVGVDFVARRVIQVIKAPVQRSLLNAVKDAELPPRVLLPLDNYRPLASHEAWRTRFAPGKQHRVLLLVHGFTSSIEESYSRRIDWVRELGANYDTVLGYSHPTIGTDVETNVQALLAFIPDDVQLQVDLICHSRGGLVGRSLIELFPSPKLQVERAVFCGSPHAGTVLADPERWDQLVGLMTNGATLAATLAGGGALGIIPKALGWVLRAAAQFASDLPGVMVMRPKGNAFLDRLNAAHVGGGLPQTRYAVAAARYSVFNPVQQSFSQMLKALAAQAFIDKPNDLVVPTASMSSIDLPQRMQLGNRVFDTAVTHFGYFDDPKVRAFIVEQLRR
jgi:hypothetical protein